MNGPALRAEQPVMQERIGQNDPFVSMISERQTALSQKVSGETVAVAQEAGMQAGEKPVQAQDNPVVRIDHSPTIREEVITVKSSEGTEMQMNGNPTREGAPSFDSHLSTAAHKIVEASVSAKQETPFLDREAQTDVIRQIVQRMTMKSDHKHSQMVIRLKPEFLGHVRLHVTTEGQQVMVRMDAESNMVKEIVEHNMPHLKAELHQHGLQIEKFDVFVGNDNDGWRSGQQQTGFRQSSKRGGQPFNSASSDDDAFDHSSDVNNRGLRAGSYNTGEVDYFA
jgi:flagellar hook-length control protein FliK